MAARAQEKVVVPCPHCGQPQKVLPAAFSTVCKDCGEHIKVQDVLKPKAPRAVAVVERRRIRCPDCEIELDVPVNAESTMCKRCSSHIDLRDYRIANAVSKNFRTKGSFVIEPKGYVFNTEANVGDAVIKGRFLGKLTAERTLTIYSGAEIKGTFTAGLLVIPVQNRFRWAQPVSVYSAEIAGELVADIVATHTVTLKSTARMFGNTQARNLVVEPGAVLVGEIKIGGPPETQVNEKAVSKRVG
jgi:cytoskeletal protein CcmA (bactofilin family)